MKTTKIKNLFFYTLTVNVSPSGSGSVTVVPLKNNYVNPEQVTLTAVPGTNSQFLNWSGDASGSTNPLTITMNTNKSITAVFESTAPPPPEDIYTLTISVNPSGSGSVAVDPQKPLYAQDEQVILTATPASGNTFLNWSGNASGSTNPLTITMNSNKSITANFQVPVQEMEVPNGGIIMYTGSDTPDGFTKIDGLHFVRISPDTSVNKTATTNKLSSHVHSIPASSTDGAHVHSTSGSTDISPSNPVYRHDLQTKYACGIHGHTTSSNNTSQNGGHSHAAMTSSAVGTLNPPFMRLNFIKNTSGGMKIAPIGSIVMMGRDAVAAMPNGWAICDGQNGTVDLCERFVYGTQNNEDLLETDGAKTHTHASKTTGAAGEHNHTLSVTINQSAGSGSITETDGAGVESAPAPHTHNSLSLTLDPQAAHTHTYPETNAASHLPPYVYLFYVQRIT
jgi:hypothetical protein